MTKKKAEAPKGLANSQGQALSDHLLAVGLVARHYAATYFPKMLKSKQSTPYGDFLLLAGLLHGIGKASKSFQDLLKDSPGEESGEYNLDDKKRNYFNEDSFLVASKNLSKAALIEDQIVPWLIYHSMPPRRALVGKERVCKESHQIKLNKGDEVKIIAAHGWAVERYEELKNSGSLKASGPGSKDSPSIRSLTHFLAANKNYDRVRAMQACLTAAIHKVDEMSPETLAGWVVSGCDLKAFDQARPLNTFEITIDDPKDRDQKKRNQEQRTLMSQAGKGITSLTAPPGWGKTRGSLLYLVKLKNHKGPILFVTPRNSIARGLYKSLIKDLKALGLKKSVSLFLTGKQQKSTHDTTPFQSDIVVTNIDSVLAPFVSHGRLSLLLTALTCTMVLDEHHEFIGDTALFAMCQELLTAREAEGAHTLLMSATPPDLKHLGITGKVKSLVVKKPVHDNDISLKMCYSTDEAWDFVGRTGCFIFNTVVDCQRFAHMKKLPVIHGSLTPDAKDARLDQVLEKHGEDNYRSGGALIATNIMQASLDVSFASMVDTLISPESTVQRSGRLGRFDDQPVRLALFVSDSGSDIQASRHIFSRPIRNLWVSFLEEKVGGGVTVKRSQLLSWYQEFLDRTDVTEKYFAWVNDDLKTAARLAMEKFAWRTNQGGWPPDKEDVISKCSHTLRTGSQGVNMNVLVPAVVGGHVTVTASWDRLKNLLDAFSTGPVKEYINTNRERLESLGLQYPKRSKLDRDNREEFYKNARFASMPLLCLEEIWGSCLGLYDTNLGFITDPELIKLIHISKF